MIVVSDSSPMILLDKIGMIDILPRLFGAIIIPPEVFDEISDRNYTLSFDAIACGWLSIQSPQSPTRIAKLDAGEAAAIQLALECHCDLIALDEQSARTAASREGLTVIGAIGLLILAARRGWIDLADAFDKVLATNFHVTREFLDRELEQFQAAKAP